MILKNFDFAFWKKMRIFAYLSTFLYDFLETLDINLYIFDWYVILTSKSWKKSSKSFS